MPNEDPKKNRTAGGKDDGGTNGSADGGNTSTRSAGKATDARQVAPIAVPEAVQTVLFGNNSKATPPSKNGDNVTQGKQPTDIELENASVKDKVNKHVQEIEKLFYAYGEQLVQGTQAVIEQAKGVDAQSAKVISSSWSQIRKKFQPQLNSCLLGIVDSIPDDFEVPPLPFRKVIHPRVRVVAFRDLVENARADITGSLEDLIKWFVAHADDPAAIRSAATLKHEACSQKYNAVLDKMGRDILERMADTGSGSIDFGRDSDYGQALKTQEALAKDRDELQLQVEGFQKQVEDLKATEAELQDRCTGLQDKFHRAQTDMLAMRDKTVILDAVTTFLGTEDQDVVGVLAHIKTKQRSLEAKLAEYEKYDSASESSEFQEEGARIADLESQLRKANEANVSLQRTVADYEKQLASGSGGTGSGSRPTKSFFKAPESHSTHVPGKSVSFMSPPAGSFSGHHKVKDSTPPSSTPPPAGSCSDSITAREVIGLFARNQAIPAPPPLNVFFGDYKEDKMSFPEFLKRYKHRYGPCSEETKVDMLGEYLAGEPKRVYDSIVSSWNGKYSITFADVESGMRNLMLDNSRTGLLLKEERVHSLRLKEGQSYLSFITLLETKVCEAYTDASWATLDGVKTKVLLKNIRDPTLSLQVEQALRVVPAGSPLFPTAKDLVIAYERTAKQALQWSGKTGLGSNHNSGAQPARTDGSTFAQLEGSVPAQLNGSAGSGVKSQYKCYSCREMGHRSFECPKNSNSITGANASGPAKFGNFSPPTCHNCGEKGHIRPNCPNKGNANAAVSSRSAPLESKHADASLRVSTVDAFLNMCAERDTEAELIRGVVGVQCVAPILVNGVTVKALFDLGSQVNIISKACLREVLRKGNACGSKLPAVLGNPPGVNLKDASGSPMAFLGVGNFMLQTSASDTAEEHKFLVQENANYDVVLGTPVLIASNSKDGVLLEDTLVKCDPSVKFCYTLVKTDGNDTATLKGCDGDPEYGLTANGKPATFCEKDGPIIVNIGTTNASLNCCDTAGCNAVVSSTSGGGSGPKSDTGDSGDLRCHFYNSDSIKGVLVTDVMVKCDAAVRFCYKLVKTVGKETTTFKGCDGDPVYGLTVDGELTSFCLLDGPVIKKTGTTETNLNCCDTTGCNSASRFVIGLSSVLAIYTILY